jgi:hypothetical protein
VIKPWRLRGRKFFGSGRRQFLTMRRHGWSWRQCVRYSWTRARAMQERDGTACAMEATRVKIEGEPSRRILWKEQSCPTGIKQRGTSFAAKEPA